jgi:hypothetical protein
MDHALKDDDDDDEYDEPAPRLSRDLKSTVHIIRTSYCCNNITAR